MSSSRTSVEMVAPEPRRTERYEAIDFVKAVAIVAVVFTHAALPLWDSRTTRADLLLGDAWTAFHVPSFLILSGFLYCGPSLAGSEIGRRFARFLVPYLLASGVVQLLGLSGAEDLGDVVFQVLTGSSLGIYYYIFQLAICTLLIWPLSRIGTRSVVLLLVALYAYATAEMFVPELVIDPSLFWAARNPLHFFLAYFVMGWVGALCLPRLRRFHAAHGGLIIAACGAGIVIWGIANLGTAPAAKGLRVIYILSAFGLLAALGTRLRAGSVVRFLSEATLGLYLFHYVFILLARPYTMDWPPLARIMTLVSIGLLGASATCLLARRLLGRALARSLVGA